MSKGDVMTSNVEVLVLKLLISHLKCIVVNIHSWPSNSRVYILVCGVYNASMYSQCIDMLFFLLTLLLFCVLLW